MGWQDDEVVTPAASEPWQQDEVVTPAPTTPPSMLAVGANAAYKGLASFADLPLNVAGAVGNALIPPPLRPGAMQNPAHTALSAAGMIRPENEPQTGRQRVLDTAIQSGVNVAMNPAKGLGEVAKNVAVGLTSGAASGITKEATGSTLLSIIAGVGTAMGMSGALRGPTAEPMNPVKRSTLEDAQAAGLVVPPSSVRPGLGVMEKASGHKGKDLERAMALQNGPKIDGLAKRAIGLADDVPLTEDAIEDVRRQAGAVYEEVASLSPRAAIVLEKFNKARAYAKAHHRHYASNKDPATLEKAQTFDSQGDRYEQQLETIAEKYGQPQSDLMERFHAARALYARTYVVEKAMNVGDGSINAAVIGRMLKNKAPLTGELRVIGKFQQAFPSVSGGTPGRSLPYSGSVDIGIEGAMGAIGYALAGPAGAAVGASLPLTRAPIRNYLMSDRYQSSLLAPPASRAVGAVRGALVGNSLLDYQSVIAPTSGAESTPRQERTSGQGYDSFLGNRLGLSREQLQ